MTRYTHKTYPGNGSLDSAQAHQALAHSMSIPEKEERIMTKRKPAVEVHTPRRKPLPDHIPIPRPAWPTWVEWLMIIAACGAIVGGIWVMVLTIKWMLV